MFKNSRFLPFFLCFFLASCVPYKMSMKEYTEQRVMARQTEVYGEDTPLTDERIEEIELQRQAGDHWLYRVVPPHRSMVRWYDLPHWCSWALFGNDYDGIFGELFLASRGTENFNGPQAASWYVRNPLHNMFFYVIGQAWRERRSQLVLLSFSGDHFTAFKYSPNADTVFPRKRSCFYLALHGWLPFLSFRMNHFQDRRGDFYIGWRERGNFGIKAIPAKKVKTEEKENKEEITEKQKTLNEENLQ